MTNDVDELFSAKNNFYVGNYQQCITECLKLKNLRPDIEYMRDSFTYRSYIAQKKYRVVLDELQNCNYKLLPIKLLAEYLYSAEPQRKEAIIGELDQYSDAENELYPVIVANIHSLNGDYELALKALYGVESIEGYALSILILLEMNRVDLAIKKHKEMQEKDDDALLTQLSQAWINIFLGRDKLQDAFYAYQELIDKYGNTPLLLNGQSVILIGQHKFEEAESALQDAYNKDSNIPDVLINLLTLSTHLEKSTEVSNRYLSQLKETEKQHSFIQDLNSKSEQFDTLCAGYVFSKA